MQRSYIAFLVVILGILLFSSQIFLALTMPSATEEASTNNSSLLYNEYPCYERDNNPSGFSCSPDELNEAMIKDIKDER